MEIDERVVDVVGKRKVDQRERRLGLKTTTSVSRKVLFRLVEYKKKHILTSYRIVPKFLIRV